MQPLSKSAVPVLRIFATLAVYALIGLAASGIFDLPSVFARTIIAMVTALSGIFLFAYALERKADLHLFVFALGCLSFPLQNWQIHKWEALCALVGLGLSLTFILWSNRFSRQEAILAPVVFWKLTSAGLLFAAYFVAMTLSRNFIVGGVLFLGCLLIWAIMAKRGPSKASWGSAVFFHGKAPAEFFRPASLSRWYPRLDRVIYEKNTKQIKFIYESKERILDLEGDMKHTLILSQPSRPNHTENYRVKIQEKGINGWAVEWEEEFEIDFWQRLGGATMLISGWRRKHIFERDMGLISYVEKVPIPT